MAAARVWGRRKRNGEKRAGEWVVSRNDPVPLSFASEGLSRDRRAPYPATKGRSPRPSSPQSLEAE
jgi:hypothetical protein